MQRQAKLLAEVAHDLRSPLQVVDATLNVIGRLGGTERELAIERARRASRTMTAMVDELFAGSSRTPSPDPGRVRISGARLLQEAVQMLMPLAERSDIRLRVTAAEDAGDVCVNYG